MAGMRAMAAGQARTDVTERVAWRGITCHYYPASKRFSWTFNKRDITEGLTKKQVISLINIELEDAAEARQRKLEVEPV
jgi:hypothetical protein